MNLSEVTKLFAFTVGGFVLSVSAYAVTDFTETFDTDDSGWLDGADGTPTYNATGGVGNSGFISYSPAAFTSPDTGGLFDPLAVLFRGNDADDASGDAFVGNYITEGVETVSLFFQHNYTETLNFYIRFASGTPGFGASLANDSIYAIAPSTWTELTINIVDSDPPFGSFGAPGGNFNNVFADVRNLQVGLYLPASTDFDSLTVGLDNVSITIPEPASLGVMGLMFGGLLSRRRRA